MTVPETPKTSIYPDATAAKKALADDYGYWSGKLTDHSFEFALAIIAANWAVYGAAGSITRNPLALASLVLVVLGLGASLLGAFRMAELHRRRFSYAESDPDRWASEFVLTDKVENPWPFTESIEKLGATLRLAKLFLPLLGALLFFASLFVADVPITPKPAPTGSPGSTASTATQKIDSLRASKR